MIKALSTLNQWISSHEMLVTVVMIPLVVFIVTRLINNSSEKKASKERALERELAIKLKLADFRQAWINDLRADIAELIAVNLGSGKLDNNHILSANIAIAKIQMRLNPEENLSEELRKAINSLNEVEGKTPDNVAKTGQKLLKQEWATLKNELEAIDQLDSRS